MSSYLHGVHDVEGAEWMTDRPGWITVTEALGSDPNDRSGGDYRPWTDRGFSIIARLNNGYEPVGTIPDANHYQDFATRCANFVRATPGISVVIIGNEPNHVNERPYGEIITPIQYAKCFDLCYQEIRRANPTTQLKICTAGVAPWDDTTRYPGNEQGDWIIYFQDMLDSISRCDAICLHTYTHGVDPDLVLSNAKMDYPFQHLHYNFYTYRDFMQSIPSHFRNLPVYITETDQVVPWADRNSGWVQEAYGEIDYWNRSNPQKIHCLCLYRTNTDDKWSIQDKWGVIEDFKEAVRQGHKVVDLPNQPSPPDPTPTPPPDPILPDVIERYIDPALVARGVEFDFVTPPAGTGYWRMIYAKWLDEEQADAVGPDHHILGVVWNEHRLKWEGIPLRVTWPSGSTRVISKAPQSGISYNYDFPMSSSLNEFSIWIDDGQITDKVMGIGMGKDDNPSIHTSTWIEWRWTQMEEIDILPPIDPIDPPIHPPIEEDDTFIHPLQGAVITQNFYSNPTYYAKYGMPGHNGTDFGGKASHTPILSIADGIVAYTGYDAGYGHYIRIAHKQFGLRCFTFFAHMAAASELKMGEQVIAGDRIGLLGTTGDSTGVHLHLEIRLMDDEGDYLEGTPMSKGRVDPRSYWIERGLKL